MNEKILDYVKVKPKLYEESSGPFWDDENISKYMLEAHLNTQWDAASRKMEFIKRSVEWIAGYCKAEKKKRLLDLGCGPGIYDELFTDKGFEVTGVDFSKRSIEYARNHAKETGREIDYYYKNYLDIDYEDEFDVVTLIYCDFGVISPENRELLLRKIHRALKDGGILIFDGCSMESIKEFQVKDSVYYEDKGFWSAEPHVCIQRNIFYEETKNRLEQYIVITKDECKRYNIWNQYYSAESMKEEVRKAGFKEMELFDDVAGKELTEKDRTICIAACK